MTFKHFLRFVDLPEIGTIKISEPFGFDGSSHKVKQDDGRFGRDVVIGNEEIELTITRDHFEIMEGYQTLQDGVAFNYASQGFDYVASEIKQKGWEAEIEYILEYNGNLFTTGIIDGYTAIVSQDEIKFKVIQNTKREEIKRREDIYVNAFSDKDLDDNPITPCSTTNILLKAKPVLKISTWEDTGNQVVGSGATRLVLATFPDTGVVKADSFLGANNIQSVTNYGIENTETYMFPLQTLNDDLITFDVLNYKYLTAINQLTNITVKITDLDAKHRQYTRNNGSATTLDGSGYLELFALVGYPDERLLHAEKYVMYRYDYGFNTSTPYTSLPSNISLNIPLIEKGQSLYIYMAAWTTAEIDVPNPLDFTAVFTGYEITTVMTKGKIEITATSTAIDSVVKGVRLIDLMKHNVKSVGGVPLIAPDYDVNGEHYNNFAFNGYLLGQIIDKPFNNRFKDICDIPQEICADYQINPTNVEIQTYANFYKNIELASFLELPDNENQSIFNKRYFLKEYWLGYNKSSDARETNGRNTIDDVHTDSQWMFESKKTDGVLKLNINHARSAYLIEEARRRATSSAEKTTSLQYDESLFLLDCVEIAPGLRKEFNANLRYRVNDLGQLLILSDETFSWNLLGFNIGNTITITEVSGTNNYTVVAYSPTLITLSGIGFTPSGQGSAVFSINYPITNVGYTNRTNEGYSFIDGVLLPEKYSNLNYSIKRNIQRWFPYLATAGKYIKGKLIKNTLFKVNGELVTRKLSETSSVVDKAPISVDDIADSKILNPIIHKVSVYCDFDKATQLFKDVQDIKGFIRVQLNTNEVIKGYPKELDYEWATNKLTLELEEKYETDFLIITGSGGNAVINGINYLGASFSVNNNFVSLYDSQDILISTTQHFTAIELNGVTFTDIDAFTDALTLILT